MPPRPVPVAAMPPLNVRQRERRGWRHAATGRQWEAKTPDCTECNQEKTGVSSFGEKGGRRLSELVGGLTARAGMSVDTVSGSVVKSNQ